MLILNKYKPNEYLLLESEEKKEYLVFIAKKEN